MEVVGRLQGGCREVVGMFYGACVGLYVCCREVVGSYVGSFFVIGEKSDQAQIMHKITQVNHSCGLYGGCREVVGMLLGCCREVVGRLYGGCREVAGRL